MTTQYYYDDKLHAVRVTLSGVVTKQVIQSAFDELYFGKYPADVNAIWMCVNCHFEISVMEVFELARITQSKREFEGYPATAFVATSPAAWEICQEYKLLVSEAPYEVEVFDSLDAAETWLLERQNRHNNSGKPA
jgi:hypothetical protein